MLPSREEVKKVIKEEHLNKEEATVIAKIIAAYINGELVEKMSEEELMGILNRKRYEHYQFSENIKRHLAKSILEELKK